MENKRIIAIDGNSLIHRAFYALPPLMTKDGLYTNAVYGFINMLGKIMSQYDPGYIVVAFDRKAPTFRHLEYEQYKAGRKKTPVELLQQFPLIKDVLKEMNIKMLEMDGYEADDLIGTVVKRAETEGLSPYVITGDKDELQLASKVTNIIITKKGLSEFDQFDEEAMIQRYQMTPAQFIDLKGLMGDSSDNIPGIPGVGEKTGINLIMQFGSIENMLKNTQEIKSEKLRQKVEENAALAMLSRKLAEINTNVPIEIDFSQFKVSPPNKEGLLSLYQKLELYSLISKLNKSTSKEAPVVTDAEQQESTFAPIQNDFTTAPDRKQIFVSREQGIPAELETCLQDYTEIILKVLGDHNHVGRNQIYGMGILVGDYFFFFDGDSHIPDLIDRFTKAKIRIKGHFLKDDYFMLRGAGFQQFSTAFDTAIAQYVIEPQRSDYNIKTLASIYLNTEIEEEKDFKKRNAQMDLFSNDAQKYADYIFLWCRIVEQLEPLLKMRIEEQDLSKVYYDIELPLIEIFADMEHQGFKIDRVELERAGKEMSQRIDQITTEIYEISGVEFNINSPKQLGVILFEKMGLTGAKKTKTGYSTSADILERMKGESPIIDLILEYRMLSKLNGTYVEGLLPLISPEDGKIRAHFQQTGTATGRISCTEPNLQNIPIRQEIGRALRKAFVADNADCVLLDADYSQIELRVLAHLSGDEDLIEAFKNGQDIHRATAARVFDVKEDEVTPLQRGNAKAVNFGVIYGMSGFGLSENLQITRKEAETYINEYFKKYRKVKQYMDDTVNFCKENGYVTTIYNRKRTIPEIKAPNYMTRQFGERLAMNSPIQGTAADIIKIAMIKVFHDLKAGGYASKMILQVHDELLINVYREELEEIKMLLKKNMMEAADLVVPLEIGMDSGNNWYEVK